MKLTEKEKRILSFALEKLDDFYKEREQKCRDFKWICREFLPQHGDEYLKNKNVFEIQDKTVESINKNRKEARELFLKLINEL